MLRSTVALAIVPLLALGCGVHGDPGTQPLMRYGAAPTFWAAPFPSEHRRLTSGRIDLADFPNPARIDLAEKIRTLLAHEATGFALSAAIFFPMTDALDEGTLPAAPSASDPHVFLIGVDPKAPDFLVRYPISARFFDDAGPFGSKNLLALLPLQGAPLRPNTLYAAGVLRSLGDNKKKALGRSDEMAMLAAGKSPSGMGQKAYSEYSTGLASLSRAGISKSDLAGITVFRTADPTADLAAFRDAMLALPPPAPTGEFALTETYDDYCAYKTEIPMPDFQVGDPPFLDSGGEIDPTMVRTELANFIVTIPRAPMPASGYPTVVFIRTGGGGDRPLIDRGAQASESGPPIVPGSGPARTFARVGFAGVSVDGPHGGLRNITHADEQFLIFNIQNPVALRDNLRESAIEIVLVSELLDRVLVDISGCTGASTPDGGRARFDTGKLALMGHSMGATIAPLVLAVGPKYRAALLSGAGGSWIENVVHKRKPVVVKGLAEILIGYSDINFELTEYDPLLSLLQWAGESADPPIYARTIISETDQKRPPAHVLMMQGIVDNYITPEIAAATSLSLGLDLGGTPLDATLPPLLPFATRAELELPIEGNRSIDGMNVTAVVVQHPEDGIADGHEVVFQTEPPKHEIRCFLDAFRRDAPPRVPTTADELAPCQ
jgi:hypothetical protein